MFSLAAFPAVLGVLVLVALPESPRWWTGRAAPADGWAPDSTDPHLRD